MSIEITAIDGTITVNDYMLSADPNFPGGHLYNGDADLISDYLASPEGEFEVCGVFHRIALTFAEGVFTMSVHSLNDFWGQVTFDQRTARELIFALAGVSCGESNPYRR